MSKYRFLVYLANTYQIVCEVEMWDYATVACPSLISQTWTHFSYFSIQKKT